MNLLRVLALFLFWSAPVSGQIVFDSSSDNRAAQNCDDCTISSFLSPSAGSDRVCLVGLGLDGSNAASVSALDLGGQSMTELVAINNAGFASAKIYYLKEAGIASMSGSDLVVTSAGGFNMGFNGACWSGVDQTTTFRDSDSQQETDGGATPTSSAGLTLDSLSGDAFYDFANVRDSTAQDPGALSPSDGTEIPDATDVVLAVRIRHSASTNTASGSTVSNSWSWTEGANYSVVAATMIPAASAAPVSAIFRMLMGAN